MRLLATFFSLFLLAGVCLGQMQMDRLATKGVTVQNSSGTKVFNADNALDLIQVLP